MNQQIKDIIFSLGLYAISIAFFFERKLSYPSNVFPYAILFILVITATMILIRALLTFTNKKIPGPEQKSPPNVKYNRVILIMISMIVYIFVLKYLGFYATSFLYLIIVSFLLQARDVIWKKRMMHSCILSPIVMLFIFLLFHLLLKVPAPTGILF